MNVIKERPGTNRHLNTCYCISSQPPLSNSEQSRNTALIKAREWLWHGYVFLPQPWLTAHGYVFLPNHG